MTTARDRALGMAKFCERWAKTDPEHAEAHKRVAASWWRIYFTYTNRTA